MAASNESPSFSKDKSFQKQEDSTRIRNETKEDLDDTSSSGTSSDEESVDDADQTNVADQIKAKPQVIRPNINNDLKSRLSAFLPQMEKANKELEDAGDALNHRIDDVGADEDRYIEMNLGLGVLSEEQDGNDIRFESSSQSESDHEASNETVETLKNLGKKDKGSRGKNKIEEI